MMITQAENGETIRGPEEWFTGAVWIETIAEEPPPSRLRAARVSFGPGARTAWHSHPCGQTLHILQGVARVQTAGEPVHEVGPGTSVHFDAGESHWHGATGERPMVHLALQDVDESGAQADWGEHVTDTEYAAR